MNKGMTGKQKCISNYNNCSINELSEKLNEILKNTLDKKESIYFAGPWFTEKARMIYNTCQELMMGSRYSIFFPREEINTTPFQAFTKNVHYLKKCDIVIALIDEKDTGTAWEIGMAYALGKKIFLLGLDESSFLSHTNVMLAFTGTCITLSNLQKFIFDEPYETVKIENNWEGIE